MTESEGPVMCIWCMSFQHFGSCTNPEPIKEAAHAS